MPPCREASAAGCRDPVNAVLIQADRGVRRSPVPYAWHDYLSNQVPVIWQPLAANEFTEIAKNLHGAVPQSLMLTINPRNWYPAR